VLLGIWNLLVVVLLDVVLVLAVMLLLEAHALCSLGCRDAVDQPFFHVVQDHTWDQACHLSVVDFINLQGGKKGVTVRSQQCRLPACRQQHQVAGGKHEQLWNNPTD
jgi:hypothetical protein